MVEDREDSKGFDNHHHEEPRAKRLSVKKLVVATVAVVMAAAVFAGSYVYAVSPGSIRNPQMDHYHFRMQIVVDGQDVNFAEEPFQTPYAKDQCSADLPAQPIHFHDQKGQFTHIHWTGITGGLVLKNYGWNLIGGRDKLLGYRLDDLPRVKSVPIHGDDLPAIPEGAQLWVYTGDEHGYQKRSIDEFKSQDLEKFFDKESNFPKVTQAGGFWDRLFPKASAHNGEHHDEATVSEAEQERLTRINNLLGNVVIFAQPNEPSDQQIKERFSHLEPLSDSTCGG